MKKILALLCCVVVIALAIPSVASAGFVFDETSEVPELQKYLGVTLEYGIWYDAYTRVYSIGGAHRVVEVSNYPRAHIDTAPHVYEVDTPFVVTYDDYGDYDLDGEFCYYDRILDAFFYIGETAIHHAGEPLPGAFPRWVEYKTVQPVVTNGYISLVKVPGPFTIISFATQVNVDFTTKTIPTIIQDSKIAVIGAAVVYFKTLR